MATTRPDADPNVGLPSRRRGVAAAYCGDAHGLNWLVDDPEPADIVELSVGGRPAWYRLARHPRTGAPALDRLSRFLYVPASDFWRRHLTPPRGAGAP